MTRPIKIAIVGDVHDQWDSSDRTALHGLGVDLVLFVGDFGNEAVGIVRQVAKLDLPKAVMLGNHDAWYSASHWGKAHCPYDRKTEDWVQLQIDLLGEDFVGYGFKDFAALGLSVVGSRPFSWGGPDWKNSSFYKTRFEVKGFEESTAKMVAAIAATGCDTLIMLGHNGPQGLGAKPESICGKDWGASTGDYGDPDLASAINHASDLGKRIAFVTFGHMHHNLRHRSDQRQIGYVSGERLYLNAACVPRIREVAGETWRNFTIVTLSSGQVLQSALVWVDRQGQIKSEKVTYCV